MIRQRDFVLSHRPYAVELDSLIGACDPPVPNARTIYRGRIDAVWYRRRRGQTVACIGHLWGAQDRTPRDAVDFLQNHHDGRYGGDCIGRWDGTSYWGTGTLQQQEEHLAILRPMLDNYPTLPDGFDGWWRWIA